MGVRVLVVMMLVFPVTGLAQDVAGAKDHPLIPRYEGAQITQYQEHGFDAYPLLVEPATQYGGIERNSDATTPIEGRRTRLTYRAPAERTSLEVSRNYRQALEAAGFETIFTCSQEACGGRNFNHAVTQHFPLREAQATQHYIAARLSRAEGDVYAAVYTAQSPLPGGPDSRRALVQVDVVEVAAMEQRMVVVEAPAMQRDLTAQGRVALYGVQFDTDRDTMREDSRPQLEQIAKLLRDAPRLKVLVVGHTDAQGSQEHNRDLSARRARSVVDALVTQHGIDRARLTAQGVGMAAPVASNRSDEGRAKNRRVELVELPD